MTNISFNDFNDSQIELLKDFSAANPNTARLSLYQSNGRDDYIMEFADYESMERLRKALKNLKQDQHLLKYTFDLPSFEKPS